MNYPEAGQCGGGTNKLHPWKQAEVSFEEWIWQWKEASCSVEVQRAGAWLGGGREHEIVHHLTGLHLQVRDQRGGLLWLPACLSMENTSRNERQEV